MKLSYKHQVLKKYAPQSINIAERCVCVPSRAIVLPDLFFVTYALCHNLLCVTITVTVTCRIASVRATIRLRRGKGLKYNFQGGELFSCPGPQFVAGPRLFPGPMFQ